MAIFSTGTDATVPRRARVVRGSTGLLAALLLLAGCGSTDAADIADEVTSAVVASEDEQAAVSGLVGALTDGGYLSMASAVEELGQFALLPDGEFTVLAASDSAFLALTSDETADVLSDPELLVRTLMNHVIEGKLTEDDLREMSSVTTMAGSTFDVVVQDGVLYINNAVVTPGEATIDRGMLHTVDTVFVP